jgi:hypothetical protein
MRTITFCILAVAFVLPLRSQSLLSGTVKDPLGAVIGGAFVLIHWDPSGSDTGLRNNIGIKADVVLWGFR